MARLRDVDLIELKKRFADNIINIVSWDGTSYSKKACEVEDVFRDDVTDKVTVYLVPVGQGSTAKVTLFELVKKEDKYTGGKGGQLASLRSYIKDPQNAGRNFYELVLEWLDGQIIIDIEPVDIATQQLEWLKKHVTRINARLPKKSRGQFERAFPGQPYTLDPNTWDIGLRMAFDEVDDIPQSLLAVKNKNGTGIDLEHKTMYNTAFIWNLVRNYPEYFHFDAQKSRDD